MIFFTKNPYLNFFCGGEWGILFYKLINNPNLKKKIFLGGEEGWDGGDRGRGRVSVRT